MHKTFVRNNEQHSFTNILMIFYEEVGSVRVQTRECGNSISNHLGYFGADSVVTV